MTPSSLLNLISGPQKHPNPKIAISIDCTIIYLQTISMLSKNQLGFLYMFLSVCAFSVMDLIVKWSENYPLGQVLFFRGFFGVILYFFIMPRERIKNFYLTKRAGLHFLRCLFGLIALIAIFIALRNLPLATVVSISFAAPIFTTIFSIFFLSEKVGFY